MRACYGFEDRIGGWKFSEPHYRECGSAGRAGRLGTPALNTLGEIKTQQGENAVVIPNGVTRLYPGGLLTQKLNALRTYSGEVWKRVGGRY
ncbi:MAG: hypothetical protein WB869_07965 [Candidatus Acidiferrales bacterium]